MSGIGNAPQAWISLWLTDERTMLAQCTHTRTRTRWRVGGGPPAPQLLATLAVLGHTIRTTCGCGLGMWQAVAGGNGGPDGLPHPKGICLATSPTLERRLTDEEDASLGEDAPHPTEPGQALWRVWVQAS